MVREEGTLEILIRREKEAGWDGIQEEKRVYKYQRGVHLSIFGFYESLIGKAKWTVNTHNLLLLASFSTLRWC